MSADELIALVCCDLGAIVRGRAVFLSQLDRHLEVGVGWVPANHALTPLGPVAEPNPFGSTGDLRLLPDPATRIRVGLAGTSPEPGDTTAPSAPGDRASGRASGSGGERTGALELLLCDIVETDGRPWVCCPRNLLRETLATLERELGARLIASFEHEFQLMPAPAPVRPAPASAGPSPAPVGPGHAPAGPASMGQAHTGRPAIAGLPFSLEAMRCVEPFAAELMAALVEAGVGPERFFAEYAPGQFEVPLEVAEGVESADRAVIFREVVREIARRNGVRASFAPLLDPTDAGNGVHIHLSLQGDDGRSLLYDAGRPGALSELGGRFAAGILRHAGALSALTAPSPISAERLRPHRWSAGAVCLARQSREALLRIGPLVSLGGGEPAAQLHLEYRGADAAANPHLALAALLAAGLEGVRDRLAPAEVLERDPAELEGGEAERFGVGALPGSLAEALAALEADERARGWMDPLLLDAYLSVKRAELRAAEGADLAETLQALCSHLLSLAPSCWVSCSRGSSASWTVRSPCASACTPGRSWPMRSSGPRRQSQPSCRSHARSLRAPGALRSSGARAARRRRRWRCAPSWTDYRSQSAPVRRSPASGGVMHACGHDVHMAALVALVRAAHRLADRLPAPLLAVFQPSEEAYPSGAEELACGALTEFAPGAVVAVHVHPEVRWGTVAIDAGVVNASCDAIEIGVEGEPAHSAYPHLGRDPILALSEMVVSLHSQLGRRIDPLRPATLTIAALEAGEAINAIPGHARARGTLRAYSAADRQALHDLVEQVVAGVSAAHGCRGTVALTPGEPPLANDEAIVACARSLLGRAGLSPADAWRSCGSDDFSFFGSSARLAMAFVGLEGAEGFAARPLHHPEFLPPRGAVGAIARAQAVLYVAAASQL